MCLSKTKKELWKIDPEVSFLLKIIHMSRHSINPLLTLVQINGTNRKCFIFQICHRDLDNIMWFVTMVIKLCSTMLMHWKYFWTKQSALKGCQASIMATINRSVFFSFMSAYFSPRSGTPCVLCILYLEEFQKNPMKHTLKLYIDFRSKIIGKF